MGASGEWGLSNKLARIIMIVTSEIISGCGFLGELDTGFHGFPGCAGSLISVSLISTYATPLM